MTGRRAASALGLVVLAAVALALGLPGAADASVWRGARVSRGPGGAMAVWSESALLVSRDDGRSFELLAGGSGRPVAVAVGAAGTVFVARASGLTDSPHAAFTLEAHVAGRPPRRSPLPVDEVHDLATGGGWLVVLGRGQLLATRDQGQTFWRSPFASDYGQVLSVDADGGIDLLVADVNTCGSSDRLERLKHLRGKAGEPLRDAPYQPAAGPPIGRWTPTGRGAVHAQSALGIVRVQRARGTLVWAAPPPPDPPPRWWPPFAVVGDGRTTVASHGGTLVRLAPGRPTELVRDLPDGFTVQAVDSHGRVLGLAGGTLYRWSAGGGLVELPVRGP
jgi:hypothetical protein